MKIKLLMCVMLGLLMAAAGWPAMTVAETGLASQVSRDSSADMPVSIREVEVLALQNNLRLQSSQLAARSSQAQVERGYGIYDPVLNLGLSGGENRDRITTTFPFIQTEVDGRSYYVSLDQKVFTGADLSLSLDHSRDSYTPENISTLNPEYRTDLTLTLTQPLLKGFGQTLTEQEILFAKKDRDISLEDLRNQAFVLLTDVRKAYFDVVGLRDNLQYRRSSVELAKRVQEENRARVEVGVLPQVELLEAEVGVKTRERDLLDAERAYRDSLDQLNLLVNANQRVRPTDEALAQPAMAMDEDAGVLSALQQRPDLQRQLRQLERLQLQRTIDKNQLLPNLDLAASYGQKGIDATASDSYSDSLDNDTRSWQVGVNLSFPLGNRAAKNDLQRTRLQIRGQESDLALLRSEIRNEIRAAMRLVEVSQNKIEVAGKGRSLAEEKLQILIGRKEVGLVTTRDVLQGEEDLALANTDLIRAVADYNKALTDYLQVTGQLLDHEGVRLVDDLVGDEMAPAFEMRQP